MLPVLSPADPKSVSIVYNMMIKQASNTKYAVTCHTAVLVYMILIAIYYHFITADKRFCQEPFNKLLFYNLTKNLQLCEGKALLLSTISKIIKLLAFEVQ